MAEAQAQIYDMPAYRAPEAARILALPLGTVNAWCFGHDYRHGDGTPKRFLRIIEPAQPKLRELSFVNLCELQVPRPLATQKFLTSGAALFVEHAGELLNVSEQEQRLTRHPAPGIFSITRGARVEWLKG